MNDQTPSPSNQEQQVPNMPNSPIVEAKTGLKNLAVKINPVIKSALLKLSESRFYKNKMIFWPITVAISLIFLIVILGLLFGKKNIKINNPIKASPTPISQVQNTPQSISNDPITQIEQNLNDLKNQINNLDVKQSRLSPPTVNFDVKF